MFSKMHLNEFKLDHVYLKISCIHITCIYFRVRELEDHLGFSPFQVPDGPALQAP